MVGQERHLRLEQDEDWRTDEGNPGDQPQREALEAGPLLLRASQELQDKERVEPPPHALAIILSLNLLLEQTIVLACRSRKSVKLEEGVEVEDHQDRRSDHEESNER